MRQEGRGLLAEQPAEQHLPVPAGPSGGHPMHLEQRKPKEAQKLKRNQRKQKKPKKTKGSQRKPKKNKGSQRKPNQIWGGCKAREIVDAAMTRNHCQGFPALTFQWPSSEAQMVRVRLHPLTPFGKRGPSLQKMELWKVLTTLRDLTVLLGKREPVYFHFWCNKTLLPRKRRVFLGSSQCS